MLKYGFDAKDEEIKVEKITVVYNQEDHQSNLCINEHLTITVNDEGGGPFFVIKTSKWTFEKIEDLQKIFDDFKEKLNE